MISVIKRVRKAQVRIPTLGYMVSGTYDKDDVERALRAIQTAVNNATPEVVTYTIEGLTKEALESMRDILDNAEGFGHEHKHCNGDLDILTTHIERALQ